MVISTIIALSTVLAILVFYIIFLWCARNILKKKFLANVKSSSYACLTFDDGPNNKFTPRLLKLLKDEKIKATFFVTGKNVEKCPQICKEIISQDHEIGEHGYNHVHPWLSMPFSSVIDLILGSSVIKKYCGNMKDILLRPPYGKLNLSTLFYVIFRKRKLAFWNIDPKDYCQYKPDIVAENVYNQLTDGAVILFHDRAYASENTMENKLTAIKMTIKKIKKRGYEFATLSEAIEICGKK